MLKGKVQILDTLMSANNKFYSGARMVLLF